MLIVLFVRFFKVKKNVFLLAQAKRVLFVIGGGLYKKRHMMKHRAGWFGVICLVKCSPVKMVGNDHDDDGKSQHRP